MTTTHTNDWQGPIRHSGITTYEIAQVALRLCEMSATTNTGKSIFVDPQKAFRASFEFAFNLLVDAEWQLGCLRAKPPGKNPPQEKVARPAA